VVFEVDLARMVQINQRTRYERKIQRVAQAAPPPIQVSSIRTSFMGSSTRTMAPAAARPMNRKSLKPSDVPLKPQDLVNEDALILRTGQLVQSSKMRTDGWAFGSIVYDEVDDRPPLGVDGLSTQAGWFPTALTIAPSQEQLNALKTALTGGAEGEGAMLALKPPSAWDNVKDPVVTEMFTLKDGPERQNVVNFFMGTLNPSKVKVVDVQRIQNMSMWQSFAVKRQTILQREKEDNAVTANDNNASRYERIWLFHGTDEDTVPKITTQGFNRSFCGKNATMYGKGVYFARDAEYSARPTYSRANSKGIQHMFLCRVTVGEYCLGKRDALTPDVRDGHRLYDTTVNDKASPAIYVTYHDAQAYPEYLVKFKQ